MQLAREFGTSHGPVREALRDLEAERLVQTEPFRGARVREVSHEELIEAYPVRVALEEAAIRPATINLEGNVGLLEKELQAMLRAAKARNNHAMMQHHINFHRILMEASRNRILIGLWKSLRTELQITMSTVGSERDQMELCERHRPILEAVAAKDTQWASQEMRTHIEHVAGLLQDDRDAHRKRRLPP